MRYFFLLFLFILSFLSCKREEVKISEGVAGHYDLESFRKVWRGYDREGAYDSLIVYAKTFRHLALMERDSIALLYANIALAQSYLLQNESDSASRYISSIDGLEKEYKSLDPSIKVILFSVRGAYAIKIEADYSKSLEYYYDSYLAATDIGDTRNQIIMLSNITSIFYILDDSSGMPYAMAARSLSESEGIEEYYKCMASLVYAQMLFLEDKYDDAMMILGRVEVVADKYSYRLFKPQILHLKANLYNSLDLFDRADALFEEAIYYSDLQGFYTKIPILLDYGLSCRQRGMYEKAIALIEESYKLMSVSETNEYKKQILLSLSVLYYDLGKLEESGKYFKLYEEWSEDTRLEHSELNDVILKFKYQEHKEELDAKEIEHLNTKSKYTFVTFTLIIVLVICILSTLLYFKTKSKYRALANQYDRLTNKEKRLKELASDTTAPEYLLFLKIEKQMKEEHAYRDKDLTPEKMAEMLNSNRSYVSKAINTYAGTTWYKYLDGFRVGEAVELIAAKRPGVKISDISEMVGYSSKQTFYRAFKQEIGVPPGQFAKVSGQEDVA